MALLDNRNEMGSLEHLYQWTRLCSPSGRTRCSVKVESLYSHKINLTLDIVTLIRLLNLWNKSLFPLNRGYNGLFEIQLRRFWILRRLKHLLLTKFITLQFFVSPSLYIFLSPLFYHFCIFPFAPFFLPSLASIHCAHLFSLTSFLPVSTYLPSFPCLSPYTYLYLPPYPYLYLPLSLSSYVSLSLSPLSLSS